MYISFQQPGKEQFSHYLEVTEWLQDYQYKPLSPNPITKMSWFCVYSFTNDLICNTFEEVWMYEFTALHTIYKLILSKR